MEITEQEEIEKTEVEEEIDPAVLKKQKRNIKTRKMALIAGIIAIVSIVIPYSFATTEVGGINLIWAFGISLVFQPLGLAWAWFPLVAVGIFCTIFLTFGSVMLTVTAVMAKTKELPKFEVYWKTSGKLILVTPIILIFYLIMRTDTYFEYYIVFIPFIGFICPVISGVIAILAGKRAGKL
ncbi:MAG: hypothetical protein JSV62_04270 [Promethearchaeota archaeon]|nr:MAG: hypothetical protein JSV62_04270 [Candidatus Lokiarchaeota archaeon]